MSIKQSIINRIERTKTGKRFIREKRSRIILSAIFSFSLNLLYAFYNGVLGIINQSVWFIFMCAYYIILSTMRFSAVLCERKNRNTSSEDMEYFVMKFCGVLFILLDFVLAGAIYSSLSQNIATKYGTIIMITIATYTFYKITVTVIKAIKQRKIPSPLLSVIRNISYVEVAASVLTLQRSMLVSFGEMSDTEIHTMNTLTGSTVCLFVLVLGVTLIIRGKRQEKIMAKSKIVKANEKIAEKVVGTFGKIEDTVVSGYSKMEDTFVDKYLTREGESVADAKERLKKEQEKRKEEIAKNTLQTGERKM